MKYTNWTNIDARFARPYQPGDRLVKGWSDDVPAVVPVIATGNPLEMVLATAERVFMRHNADDRPDGQLCPSMSVGDVVAFGEVAVSVDRRGFVQVSLDPSDLIVDRAWGEVIA